MQPKAPAPPNGPVLAPTQITIAGSPLGGPVAIYEGFRAQARELNQQMSQLEDQRGSLTRQLQQTPGNERTGLEQRIAGIDGRIIAVDKQIADADAQLAKAAAIPGAVVETPPPIMQGPSEDFVMSALFITGALLLPLSIAFARRIWKRTSGAVTPFPREIGERLGRVEAAVDSTALEVERIGEGQRFLTRLFTEGDGARPLAAPAIPLLQRKSD
jgi:hypothetical protein